VTSAQGATPALYAKLILMAAMWGGLFSAGRVLAPLLPPFAAGTLRFIVAASTLVALAYAREGGLPRLDARQSAAMAVLGLTGAFLFNAFFFLGLERIPASRASLVMALNPAGTAVAMWIVYRERLAAVQWGGIALALTGVAVVLSHGDLATLFTGAIGPGDVLVFGCVVSWSVYTLVARREMGRISPLAMTTYGALFGLVMLAACVPFERPWAELAALPLRGWLAVLYAGFFATVLAFLFFNDGVKRIGPSRTSVFINLVPVFGVLIAATLLGERVEASTVTGGALVVAGVMLVNRAGRALRAGAAAS
jgi:drug/metabolite transporter (DMT)-like permease